MSFHEALCLLVIYQVSVQVFLSFDCKLHVHVTQVRITALEQNNHLTYAQLTE